jgi:hypothetical protein
MKFQRALALKLTRFAGAWEDSHRAIRPSHHGPAETSNHDTGLGVI